VDAGQAGIAWHAQSGDDVIVMLSERLVILKKNVA
jgi:hypothetical protein